MIKVAIPGYKKLVLKFLVLDYNGTLGLDGKLKKGVKEKIDLLSKDLEVHVVTGDTFNTASRYLEDVNCKLAIAPKERQDIFKLNYIESLGKENVVSIGNGRNDVLMLEAAALGIAILGEEGLTKETILSCDIMVKNILNAFDLLLNSRRLMASLRS